MKIVCTKILNTDIMIFKLFASDEQKTIQLYYNNFRDFCKKYMFISELKAMFCPVVLYLSISGKSITISQLSVFVTRESYNTERLYKQASIIRKYMNKGHISVLNKHVHTLRNNNS